LGLTPLADLKGGLFAWSDPDSNSGYDIHLPDCSGMTLFERIGREAHRTPPCVFITGCGNIEDTVRLLKLGAADYLTKPLDPTALVDKLRILVRETDQARSRETPDAAAGPAPDAGARGASLGISPAMRRAPTPARSAAAPGSSSARGWASCSWTRSATCRSPCNRDCCGCCNRAA
jgi:DNA-binding NtrC family response regulator